jgi:hypothetical protein
MTDMLNTGITVPPLPRNERATAYGLDILPASFAEGFGAQFDDQMTRNPTPSFLRGIERGKYYPITDEYGTTFEPTLPSKMLTAQEANDQYGIAGRLKFDADTPEAVAQELKALKVKEIERQETMRRAQAGLGTALTAGLAATILDPINIASAFIPVIGEARYAAMVARFGATGARAARGAAEGFVGAALVEPIVYVGARQEQADYDAADSLANLAFGTVLGAGLHVAGGAVKDRFFTGAVDNLPPADREALLRASVAQVAEGRPVEVGDILRSRLLGNVGESLDKVFDDLLPTELKTLKAAEAAAPERMGPDATAFALKKQIDAVGVQLDTANARLTQLQTTRDGIVENVNQPLEDAVAASRVTLAEARKDVDNAKAELERARKRANPLRDAGLPADDSKLVRALAAEETAAARFSAAQSVFDAADAKFATQKTELANFKANEAKRVGEQQAALDPQIERATAERDLQKQNLQDALTAADAEKEGRLLELRSQLELARAQATEALRAKLAEAMQGPTIRLEPEGAQFLSDIERRFSEVQARPDAIADELKTVEAEVKELDRLLPADSEAKATTPAMQEANVYAKAWEAAVACRVGKA